MFPTIYVAHPYTADTLFEKSLNVESARSYTRLVASMGAAPLCPVTMCAYMDGSDIPEERWIEYDLRLLTRCDAIYMCGAWESSAGCKREWAWAMAHDIPVLQSVDQVRVFVDGFEITEYEPADGANSLP